MKKLKIAIVHPDPVAEWSFPSMWDGLKAAINIIGKKHAVKWFLGDHKPDNTWDWILPWGVCSMPFNQTLGNYSGKKALLCAGHPDDIQNIDQFEAVFVESPLVYEKMKDKHPNVILAFGTDMDFFSPNPNQEKIYDAFYPGTLSDNWKRQNLFAEATRGYRSLCAGVIQPDGVWSYRQCMEANTDVIAGLLPTKLIADLYQMSKTVVITGWHGSERSALEAAANNLPLVVTKDNDLLCSIFPDDLITKVDPTPKAIRDGFLEALTKTVDTRKYLFDQGYTAEDYANKILKVIE